jgi:hypothetical protein
MKNGSESASVSSFGFDAKSGKQTLLIKKVQVDPCWSYK